MSKLIFDYFEVLKAASQKTALTEDDLSGIDRIKTEFSEIRSSFSNHALEEEGQRMENRIHELELEQVIFRKQIEDRTGLLRRREHEITDLEQKVGAQSARLGEIYKINHDLSVDLNLILGSRSWKITTPLRAITTFLRRHSR